MDGQVCSLCVGFLEIDVLSYNSVLMNSSAEMRNQKAPVEERQSLEEEDEQYMGKDSNTLSRFLSLQYLGVLPAYCSHYQNNRLLKFRQEYNHMIENEYMWHKFLSKGATFNLYQEVFEAEKGPFILLIVLSIVIAILALFGAYYQRFLFRQLLDPTFQTSGWVFFGVIAGSAVLRFFLFNYVQNLANFISINVRCHLENSLIRLFFHLPASIEQGLLINNFLVSLDLVTNTINLLPYFIVSLVIVCGIVGFIIDIVGVLGLVVLGLTLLFLGLELLILKYMLHLHHQYVKASDKRTSLTIFGTSMLLRLTYNGLAKPFLELIKKYRKQETNIDRKYNLMDGVIEILTQSISFISLFIFYLSSEYNHETPSYVHILDAAILFSVFKTPIKMVGYGLSMCLEGYAGLDRLQGLFDECQLSRPPRKQMRFPRLYPLPSIFESQLQVHACFHEMDEINLKPDTLIHKHTGKLIMIVGKVDAVPNCDQFLEQIEMTLRYSTYCKIDYEPLIIDKNIRENIIFGLPFDEKKYYEVLEIVNLIERLNQFPEGDQTRMDQNYFKTIYLGFSLKIQLARALYSDVEVLIINRLIFKEFEVILKKTREYRKKRNHTTVVVNLSGSHYDIADWLIVLGRASKQQGTYQQLIKTSQILQEFEVQYLSHLDLIKQNKFQATKTLQQLDEAPLDEIEQNCFDLFKFYGLSHCGAGAVLIVLLMIPPLIDLYMQIIIAQSVAEHTDGVHAQVVDEHEETHYITLRLGISILVFIVMNLVKVLFFSQYIRLSGYKIVKNVIKSFLLSKIESTLDMSNRKSALDLQRNIEQLDTRITTDMDVGVTIIFEQVAALVFGTISSVLFLAIGGPFFVVTIVVIVMMIKYSRKLLFVRRLARSRFNSFIKKLVIHRKDYMNFDRDEYIFQEYIEHNKKDIEADLNEEWVLEALGIILEIVFMLMLITTLAVSLTHFEIIHQGNEAFLELAISFLIGLSNGARFNLKIFRSMDKQLAGITSINKIIQHHQINRTEEILEFPDNRIFEVEFKDFSINFKDDILHKLNLFFKVGERIVITGSRRSGKRVAFYAALGVFQPEHVRGDIYINRTPIYKERITRASLSDKIYILENQTLTVFGDTVAEAIHTRAPRRLKEQMEYTINELWRVLGVEPLFDVDTKLKDLSAPALDLFSLIRALMVRPDILVLEGGLTHIDTVNRRKITKWLISHNQISVLIDLTNRIEVIKLYPRQIQFKQGQIVKDIKQIPQ